MAFKLIGSSAPFVLDSILSASVGLASGEFDQGDFEHNPDVTEEDYINIVSKKTAGLFAAAARIGAYTADPGNDAAIGALSDFALNVGIAFQIVDDILDEVGESRTTGKRIGNDIVDGKPTLPIIYAMEDPRHGPAVREIFTAGNADYDDASRAISLISRTDSIERCRRLASEYAAKARARLDGIPPSPYRDCLGSMVQYITSRDRRYGVRRDGRPYRRFRSGGQCRRPLCRGERSEGHDYRTACRGRCAGTLR